MGPTFHEFLARLRAEPAPAPGYGPYRSYRALFDEVAALVERALALALPATLEMFGRSAAGEPLWALHLGPSPHGSASTGSAGPRGRLLCVAGLHAQEFIGCESALAIAHHALDRLSSPDPLLDGLALTLVPCANPDGYRRVAAEAARARPRFRRHNARGVDLNRNFAEGFDPFAPLALALPALFAPGRAPLSEPETAALDALFARGFDRALSLHSFGELILWPWAGRAEPTVDDALFSRLADRMRARMRRPHRAAQLGRWAHWFRAGGSEIDHLYGHYGTAALLLEIGPGGRDATSPRTWLDAFSHYNPRDVATTTADVAAAALALAEGPWPLPDADRPRRRGAASFALPPSPL